MHYLITELILSSQTQFNTDKVIIMRICELRGSDLPLS